MIFGLIGSLAAKVWLIGLSEFDRHFQTPSEAKLDKPSQATLDRGEPPIQEEMAENDPFLWLSIFLARVLNSIYECIFF